MLASAIASLMLAAGLVVVTAATTQAPAQAAPKFRNWGKAFSSDHVLRSGCRKYAYRYRINPPDKKVAIGEIFLVGPTGTAMAHDAMVTGANRLRGKAEWTLCRNSMRYGRHKIRMKVTYRGPDRNPIAAWVRPTTFRFTRPR